MFALLLLLCAVGSALVGGVLFAFSIGVMRALSTLPTAHGIRAMQAINVAILNAWFLGAFVGTTTLCAIVLVWSVVRPPITPTAAPIAGSVLYLVGVVFVTRAFHIPRNDALASAEPETPDAEALWRDYLAIWTPWNHVRTAAAVAAALAFGAALAWPQGLI